MSNFSRSNSFYGNCIYVKNNLTNYSRDRKDLVGLSLENCIESSAIELKIPYEIKKIHTKTNLFVITSVFGPPNALLYTFFDTIDCLMSKIASENKPIICCGDFNINLLRKSPEKETLSP